MTTIPTIKVGIQSEKVIEFSLNGDYCLQNDKILNGKYKVSIFDNKIKLENDIKTYLCNSSVIISPKHAHNNFTLFNVKIGKDFHWQQFENQIFNGSLQFISENNEITAINIINIEDYLTSVISSEMSAHSSLEFLKAHAVISRSWLLAQINKNKQIKEAKSEYTSCMQTESELIRWYDREEHLNFDVCSDDHCQRYQGISRKSSSNVERAVQLTFGECLVYNGKICDARFSKCCGGISENFENVWENVVHPYLDTIIDNSKVPDNFNTSLQNEENAEAWICGNPDAYCNTDDKAILKQVLNNYDQKTSDYYRWTVEYEQKELSELVKKRMGIDFGLILDLKAVERGNSGRIIKLKISGTKKTFTIGKELEIRKALSETHLYSSAFVVSKKIDDKSKVKFVLQGAGWGHGVGLCQIGAAVMGQKGFDYKQILKHYFKNADLEKQY